MEGGVWPDEGGATGPGRDPGGVVGAAAAPEAPGAAPADWLGAVVEDGAPPGAGADGEGAEEGIGGAGVCVWGDDGGGCDTEGAGCTVPDDEVSVWPELDGSVGWTEGADGGESCDVDGRPLAAAGAGLVSDAVAVAGVGGTTGTAVCDGSAGAVA